jgi:hypothetical protein
MNLFEGNDHSYTKSLKEAITNKKIVKPRRRKDEQGNGDISCSSLALLLAYGFFCSRRTARWAAAADDSRAKHIAVQRTATLGIDDRQPA